MQVIEELLKKYLVFEVGCRVYQWGLQNKQAPVIKIQGFTEYF